MGALNESLESGPRLVPLKSLVVGSISCPLLGSYFGSGVRGALGVVSCGEIPEVTSGPSLASERSAAGAESWDDRWQLRHAPELAVEVDLSAHSPWAGRVDPMELEAELGAVTPSRMLSPWIDMCSPELGPRRSAQDAGPRFLRSLIDAIPGLRGERVTLWPIKELGRVSDSPTAMLDRPKSVAWEFMELKCNGPNPEAVQATLLNSPTTASATMPTATSSSATKALSPAASLRSDIEAGVCIPLDSPIIRAGPRLRKSRTPASVLSLRRSSRLAVKPRAANATLQA
jgi:hypothetical protein